MAEAPTLTRFTLTVDAGVAELTLAVPEELNRMPPAFWEELPAALEALEARGDVRVLIIASTGKHFTAGMDVSAFDGSGATPTDRGLAGERSRRHLLKLQDVFSRLERARFPVIARPRGAAGGGGPDCSIYATAAPTPFSSFRKSTSAGRRCGHAAAPAKAVPAGLMRERPIPVGGSSLRRLRLVNAVLRTRRLSFPKCGGSPAASLRSRPWQFTVARRS